MSSVESNDFPSPEDPTLSLVKDEKSGRLTINIVNPIVAPQDLAVAFTRGLRVSYDPQRPELGINITFPDLTGFASEDLNTK